MTSTDLWFDWCPKEVTIRNFKVRPVVLSRHAWVPSSGITWRSNFEIPLGAWFTPKLHIGKWRDLQTNIGGWNLMKPLKIGNSSPHMIKYMVPWDWFKGKPIENPAGKKTKNHTYRGAWKSWPIMASLGTKFVWDLDMSWHLPDLDTGYGREKWYIISYYMM